MIGARLVSPSNPLVQSGQIEASALLSHVLERNALINTARNEGLTESRLTGVTTEDAKRFRTRYPRRMQTRKRRKLTPHTPASRHNGTQQFEDIDMPV